MLKNYQSSSPLPNIFNAIQKTLLNHKAKQVSYFYDDQGRTVGISFIVSTEQGELMVKLPANFRAVEQIFKNEGVRYKPEQPYRTAWATIRDWLDAQMALIDWGMVRMEEVFLPYVVKNGMTFFEYMQNKKFELPEGEQ